MNGCQCEIYETCPQCQTEKEKMLAHAKQPERPMNYKLVEWEDNGYNDSDFYGVAWNDDKGCLEKHSLGSTSFSGGYGFDDTFALPTPEILDKARRALAKIIFEQLTEAENRDVFTPKPSAITPGTELILLKKHTFGIKAKVKCEKCGGTGKWVNPRNPADERKCFACNGEGLIASKDFLKHETTNRRLQATIPEGSLLVAAGNAAFFGTTYANGYNKPDRDNTLIPVVFLGQRVRVPTAKFRLARNPMSPAELGERAVKLSYHHRYGTAFGMKAWESDNWAADLQRKLTPDRGV